MHEVINFPIYGSRFALATFPNSFRKNTIKYVQIIIDTKDSSVFFSISVFNKVDQSIISRNKRKTKNIKLTMHPIIKYAVDTNSLATEYSLFAISFPS